jgi:ubiquinone/menaquinone biosynthesis C-methylase UbiE
MTPDTLDQKQSVQAQFGPVAANYASAAVHSGGPDLDALLPAAALRGDERLLDVGCGAGHTALAFAPHVATVEALDLTQGMLDQVDKLTAERGVRNLVTKLGDVEALPYPRSTFDIVTCRLCAHHFVNPGRALSEISRVLVPGGLFLLVDIVSPETAVSDTFLNTVELMRDPSHVRDHSISQWLAMLGAAGFASELLASWPMHLDFASWVTRIGASADAERGLRTLFAAAAKEVQAEFAIDPDDSFTITNALFRARTPAASC